MVINTGVKANSKFMEILNSVIGQMSDGIWENTRSMEKYWKSLNVRTNEAGMIEIEDRYNVCSNPVEFMANKIKQIIKIEIEDGYSKLEWSRTCSACPSYIGYHETITVGDCYELYELLKGRNTTKNRYSSYKPYNVTLTYESTSFTISVDALSEYDAKSRAIKKLTDKITAVVKPR